MNTSSRSYTQWEERANWLTHGLGVVLSVAGAVFVFWTLAHREQSSAAMWISAAVYTAAMILLYSISTLYHYIEQERWKQYFRLMDHSAIYVKIAGTYTPFLLLVFPQSYGYEMLIAIWSITIGGILFKLFSVKRFNIVSTLLYLAMGWMAVLFIQPLYQSLSREVFIYVIAGGACFSLGVIFYLMKSVRYSHSIWHVFVMGGSAFHYAGIYLLLS
ncbi:MAG: hemolysin III family protein [Cyclobacteriaceae bacterium]|nr:hemolysin III family protein [Cyclobacteriaceae bacterium]